MHARLTARRQAETVFEMRRIAEEGEEAAGGDPEQQNR